MITPGYLRDFSTYLRLERGLSINSVKAYINDVSKLAAFFNLEKKELKEIKHENLVSFISWLNELGMLPTSQARVISGLKSYFGFLCIEEIIHDDPTTLLELPKVTRKLFI